MKTIHYDPIAATAVDLWYALGGMEPVLAGLTGVAAAWFVWRHWPDVGP